MSMENAVSDFDSLIYSTQQHTHTHTHTAVKCTQWTSAKNERQVWIDHDGYQLEDNHSMLLRKGDIDYIIGSYQIHEINTDR